jgi:hypothetical protein
MCDVASPEDGTREPTLGECAIGAGTSTWTGNDASTSEIGRVSDDGFACGRKTRCPPGRIGRTVGEHRGGVTAGGGSDCANWWQTVTSQTEGKVSGWYETSDDGRVKCWREVSWNARPPIDFSCDSGSKVTSVRDLQSAKQQGPIEVTDWGIRIF